MELVRLVHRTSAGSKLPPSLVQAILPQRIFDSPSIYSIHCNPPPSCEALRRFTRMTPSENPRYLGPSV
ncbi:hypothetical protein M407DRAFT_241389, partial [Tulasnella calospora MUT 4182]